MNINYYIDESGIEDWNKEKYFTVAACAINEKDESSIQQKFDLFKNEYSEKLGHKIKYLHGSEITYGMNQGIGIYGKLKSDKLIREQFFLHLVSLLSLSKYKLLTCTLNLEVYLSP